MLSSAFEETLDFPVLKTLRGLSQINRSGLVDFGGRYFSHLKHPLKSVTQDKKPPDHRVCLFPDSWVIFFTYLHHYHEALLTPERPKAAIPSGVLWHKVDIT